MYKNAVLKELLKGKYWLHLFSLFQLLLTVFCGNNDCQLIVNFSF